MPQMAPEPTASFLSRLNQTSIMYTLPTSVSSQTSRAPRLLTAMLFLMVLLGFGRQAEAGSGLFKDFVILHPGSSSPAYYDTNFDTGNPDFMTFGTPRVPANLGSYDRNSGQLMLDGAEVNTFENSGDVLDSAYFYYRVYKAFAANGDAGTGGTFRRVALLQVGTGTPNGSGGTDRTFSQPAATTSNFPGLPVALIPINLITMTSGPGQYYVEVYFKARGTNGGTRFSVFDSRGGLNYRATFTVTGSPQASTTWIGGNNPNCLGDNDQNLANLIAQSNWFDPANWTNGVPTSVTDATVPNYATATATRSPNPCVVYPNIRGTATTGPAEAHNLTLEGSNPSDRSIMRLLTGELKIYGTFSNIADSYIQRANTAFTLAGGNQTFDGSANFKNFTVDGGGVKTLTVNAGMIVDGSLRFINGVLKTQIANASGSIVTLLPSTSIIGESETSYVDGIITDKESAEPGVTQNFGNIGIDLTFTSGDPNGTLSNGSRGGVRIVRTTGVSAGALLGSKPSIKRTFGIQPDNATTLSNVLVARVGVRWLDRETQQVSAAGVGPINLDETQFTIWQSTSGGAGFQNFGRDRIDPTNNRVTQNGITTFATLTLGENQTPLPVNYLYFTAQRDRKGALLNWGTTLQEDNAGFEVQMSLDGREFRTLTTVVPANANSKATLHYSYTDATATSGTRYYRLRQVDTNGTFSYTPVRVVEFGGLSDVVASTSSVFPNPFRNGEQLMVSLKADVAGKALVRVTDALGREITRQMVDITAGGSTVALPSLDNKPVGVYLVRLTMPNGTTQTIKVQKQ